jgi:hypothetical protein
MPPSEAFDRRGVPTPTRTELRNAGLACLLLPVVTGAARGLNTWYGFRRFAVDLAPAVTTLAIVRGGEGAGAVALVACLLVTALVHASSDRSRAARTKWTRIAGLAAAGTTLLTFPATIVALSSALLTLRLVAGSTAGWLRWIDKGDLATCGLVALLAGVVPLTWTPIARATLSSARRGLAYKMLVTWVVLVGPAACVGLLAPEQRAPVPPEIVEPLQALGDAAGPPCASAP